MRVYVAGPITKGDQFLNVRNAILVADDLLFSGMSPFVPHLCSLWHIVAPQDYERWMSYDQEWLEVCDVLLRIPGESSGADREIVQAMDLGIPVYYDLQALIIDFKNGRLQKRV